jgi:hypothetical protein
MTDSMVERVARAMTALRYDGIYKDAHRPPPHRERWVDGYWPNYADDARAAIEAMRTPTPEMVKQGARSMAVMSPTNEAEYEAISEVWQDMITAALDTRDDGRVAETAGALAPSVPE